MGRDKKALDGLTFVLDGPEGVEVVAGVDPAVAADVLELHAMSATVLLLSGPNLNLLGQREPEIYGTATLDDHVAAARAVAEAHDLELEHLQSNHEGDLIDAIHAARGRCRAIIVNAGAFTHYAWALHDALAAFDGPIVELHLSNPGAREPWRSTSVVAPVATGSISGLRRPRLPDGRRRRGPPAGVSARADLPPMDVAGRLDRLRAGLAPAGCDVLVVGHLTNIRYLTGFTGSAATLVVAPDGAVLVTDGRYAEQAADELAAVGVAADLFVGRTLAAQRTSCGRAWRASPASGSRPST